MQYYSSTFAAHFLLQVMGYKGCPVLALHSGFDINGMVTDYLHCVLLGVSKTLLTLWLDSSNADKEFYIGNKVKQL